MNDPEKVGFWANADVFISTDLEAPTPTEGHPFSSAWLQVGLLNGDDGFSTTREEDSTKHYAWGHYIGERTKNFSESISFTALETNPVTRMLRYPGSPDGGIKQPDRSIRYLVGVEKREGNKVHRRISAYMAEIKLDGDVSENESDPDSYTFLVTPLPDPSTGLFWVEQGGPTTVTVESITVTGDALIAEGEITKLAVEATFSDSSTLDVTSAAVWHTTDDEVVTVAHGYATGGNAGTATLTARFRGVTDTHEIEVTS